MMIGRALAHEVFDDGSRRELWCYGKPGCIAGDQPRAAAIGEPGPDPVQKDRHSIAEPDQKENVNDAPEDPGREACELEPAEIGDRRVAADGRKRPLVVIAEGRG